MNGRELVLRFCEKWCEKNHGRLYFPSWGKDSKNLKRAADTIGEEELLTRMDAYFLDEEQYLLKVGYCIGIFLHRLNQYDPALSNQYRARAEATKLRRALVEMPRREPEEEISLNVSSLVSRLSEKWKSK